MFIKTVERAHSPKNMWEKIKLKKNLQEAFEQIHKNMEFWPEHMINRCKARLIKLQQMIMRQRKLVLKGGPKLVPIKKKMERREATREEKAERAAKVDLAIEQELLQRLKQGTYGSLYNLNEKAFKNMLDAEGLEKEEDELDEDDEDMEDDDEEPETTFVEDFEESDEEEEEDMENMHLDDRQREKKRGRMEIEYETEDDTRRQKVLR